MSAEVELFTTSILGNPVTRSRHDRYISVLSAHRIPFVYHDLASDDEAKRRWRRKVRAQANTGTRPTHPGPARAQRVGGYV